MRMAGAVALLLSMTAIGAGCGETPEGNDAHLTALGRTRESQLRARLAAADKSSDASRPVASWIMPPELREISGLTLTPDGNVLAHDDEFAKVYVIDPRQGMINKRFTLGTGFSGDFESITMAGSDIYMLSSSGLLYQFREGDDEAEVPHLKTDLHLGKLCEFESMVYQADSNWLVMPCKNAKDKAFKDDLVIYRWRLSGPDSARASMVSIPFARLVGSNKWKSFHASDITIDPSSGNFVMIASHEKALIEITPSGSLVRAEPLPQGHNQPEGVAITKDSILIVSDEATGKPAAITLYRWHPTPKTGSIQ